MDMTNFNFLSLLLLPIPSYILWRWVERDLVPWFTTDQEDLYNFLVLGTVGTWAICLMVTSIKVLIK